MGFVCLRDINLRKKRLDLLRKCWKKKDKNKCRELGKRNDMIYK